MEQQNALKYAEMMANKDASGKKDNEGSLPQLGQGGNASDKKATLNKRELKQLRKEEEVLQK